MTLPSVLICAPIRYRPECPEVLGEYLDALRKLEWPAERLMFYFLIQDADDYEIENILRSRLTNCYRSVVLWAEKDSRLIASRGIPSPRTTRETQLNLAYLRSRLFHHWEHQTTADLCLMVDSDVVLAPGALMQMHAALEERGTCPDHEDCPLYNPCGKCGFDCCECNDGGTQKCGKPMRGDPYALARAKGTITLQINNCPFETGDPASNAQLDTTQTRAPWATDGSVIEVARAGACTLYPRAAARYRFTFDPTRHNEEHQGLFDRLREDGFRHYLLRDPKLADHRMAREPDAWTALQKVRESQAP